MEAVTYVVDLPRCVGFYAEVLGLQVRESGAGYCILDGASGTLTLVRIPEAIAAQIDIEVPPQRREQTPIKLIFPIPDISRARELATRFGGVIDPVPWQWHGSDRCDGMDPEGNVLQVSSALSKRPSGTTT